MSKFNCILLMLAVSTLFTVDIKAQVAVEDTQFMVITRDDGSAYIMHDLAIPLSHGFHVHRRIEGGEWERLTETHIMPVQSGPQLEQRMGGKFEFLKERLGIEDPQRIFLSLRAQTDENTVVNAALPELSVLLGRSYVDENVPLGSEVAYRFEIVSDLGRPTGREIEGTAQLSPETPVAPTNLSVSHEDRQVQLNWNYPTHDQNPDTDKVIRFKTYYRDLESGRTVDATDAILLRTVGDTDFRKYITVPNRNRDYEFWVEAIDFSGQSSPQSESVVVRIEDNIPPPILRNVNASVNDAYHVEITWPVSTVIDLAGYHVYMSRGEDEEYERLTDEILLPLQVSYIDTTAEPGVQYRYAITVVDMNANESSLSNPTHVYVWDYTTPEPVTNLEAVFLEDNLQVRLNWEPGEEYLSLRTYQILRRQINPVAGLVYEQINEPAFKEEVLFDDGYEDDGFREGVSFEYGITAVSENGNRSDTVWTDIQIPVLTPPEPPTSIQTNLRTGERVQLTWTASVSGAVSSYRIYRKAVSTDSTSLLAENNRGIRLFRDENVEVDNRYIYSVTAVDSVGNESEPIFGDTLVVQKMNPPVSTRNVQAVHRDGSVQLQWQMQDLNHVAGFRIYRATIATGNFDLIGETESDELIFSHNESEAGQWFKVFPFDRYGREARTARAVQAVSN
ncbi:MAG: hypothetical protein WEA58_06310 [Balneolaceae bacterium]